MNEDELRAKHRAVLRDLVTPCTHRHNEHGHDKTTGLHLLRMIREIATDDTMPIDKVARWTGFIQGVLATRGVISVDEERDRTRRIFTGEDKP